MIEANATQKIVDDLRGIFPQAFITNDLADVSRVETDKWLIRVRHDGAVASEDDVMAMGAPAAYLWSIVVVLRSHVGARTVDEVVDIGLKSLLNYFYTTPWKVETIGFDGTEDYHEVQVRLEKRV